MLRCPTMHWQCWQGLAKRRHCAMPYSWSPLPVTCAANEKLVFMPSLTVLLVQKIKSVPSEIVVLYVCETDIIIIHMKFTETYCYYIRLTAFFQETWVSQHQKGKPFWILMKREMMGGSGVRWTVCKSFAPSSWQIATPVLHQSVFTCWMPFLPPNQQHQSTCDSSSSFNYDL